MCGCGISLTNGVQFSDKRIVILFRKQRQVQQRIRHAAQRGNDHADTIIGVVKQQFCNATKTVGVSETAATKLVDVPTALQCKLPLRKTVNNSGSLVGRRLFCLQQGWWGV